MPLWIFIPLLFLAAICQATMLPLITIAGFKIDLALILVVAWGLTGKRGQAAAWGFVSGIFLDLESGMPFGIQTIALTGIGLLMEFGQYSNLRDSLILPPAAMIITTLIYDLFLLFALSLLNPSLVINEYLLRIIVPSAVINTLALPLAYIPFQWIAART
jgi:rod shape-determining protein MreD